MDRFIAPQMPRKRKRPSFSKSRMVIPSPGMREKPLGTWDKLLEVGLKSGAVDRPDWRWADPIGSRRKLPGPAGLGRFLQNGTDVFYSQEAVEPRCGGVALGDFWMHERWLTVIKEPLEVAVVVIWREKPRVDPTCKRNEDSKGKLTRLGSRDETPCWAKTSKFARDLSTLRHPWDMCKGGWWVVVAWSDPLAQKCRKKPTGPRRQN
ncbi:hypothetical protein CRG98_011737 [Punica granatum]|uniref:Uncharacterized protein n=1 Tax=Punica granatum TaxID=22663 RepID=A0A2I0KH61_PUNGR|nr:hypothetical protein CRG98_011737 [Punica granatum]